MSEQEKISIETYLNDPFVISKISEIVDDDEFDAVFQFLDWIVDIRVFNSERNYTRHYFDKKVDRFERELNQKRSELALLSSVDEDVFELKNPSDDKAVCVVGYNTYPNFIELPWRVSFFRDSGPTSHSTDDYATRDEAIIAAVRAGYKEHCEGVLDKFTETPEWEKGFIVVNMLHNGRDPFEEVRKVKDGEDFSEDAARLMELVNIIDSQNCDQKNKRLSAGSMRM